MVVLIEVGKMTINAHIEEYPKGTKSVPIGEGKVKFPVVQSMLLLENSADNPLYYNSSVMTLKDIAKETFFQCYREEFHDIYMQTEASIQWNKRGENRKIDNYHIKEGVKCSKFNRKPYLPFDNNRITVDGEYLNASPVIVGKNGFIVMQSPLPAVFFRFWEMIWRKNVNFILLISNIGKNNHSPHHARECHHYWPQSKGDKISLGRLHIEHLGNNRTRIGETLFGTLIFLDEVTFSIKAKNRRARQVKQLHFKCWDENYEPDLMAFMNLIIKVQHCASRATGPLVVQSSAGAGRAGTFIAAFTLVSDVWNRVVKNENFDDITIFVKERVMKLREQRYGMVLTESQYLYIYKVMKKLVDLINDHKSKN